MINEAEVIEFLAQRGFKILDSEKEPVDVIAATLAKAKMFVTVEGSQEAHAIYALDDKSGHVSIQAPDLVTHWWTDCSWSLGSAYGFVIGEACGGGFKVDLSTLGKTVDLVAAKL